MACFYTSVTALLRFNAAVQQRDKIFSNMSQQNHWEMLHRVIPEEGLQIPTLNPELSPLEHVKHT